MKAPQLPAFAWTKSDGDKPARLAIFIYRARSGAWRGKVWLGRRWSAVRSFRCHDLEGWADEDAARRLTNFADWRDYKGEAVLEGVIPKRGMWLVHHERRRVYGEIVKVTAKGTVIWRGEFGEVPTLPATLHAGGYSYTDEPPADYERWAA